MTSRFGRPSLYAVAAGLLGFLVAGALGFLVGGARAATRTITLVAEPGRLTIRKGLTVPVWTFNGTVPGPEIRAYQVMLLGRRTSSKDAVASGGTGRRFSSGWMSSISARWVRALRKEAPLPPVPDVPSHECPRTLLRGRCQTCTVYRCILRDRLVS